MIYKLEDYDNWQTLKEMYIKKHIPKLYHIYIETTNFCNYDCPFCPVGQGKRIEEKHIMTFDFFKNIIDMLSKSSLTQQIKITLYGNNEPLLDPTIVDKINYVKQKLPFLYVYISTNGLLLEQYIDQLYSSNIDCLYIQAYTEDIYEKITYLLQQKNYQYDNGSYTTSALSKIYIVPRFNTKYKLINRAGQAYVSNDIQNMCCICLFTDLVITSKGNIQMCTFDALGETMFDNIQNYQTLESLWYSKKYKQKRYDMLRYGKFGFDVCKKCDINNNQYRLYFYLKK